MNKREFSKTQIDGCKESILNHLLNQPMEIKELYAIIDPDLAFQALLGLTFDGKVWNEGLTYFHIDSPQPSPNMSKATSASQDVETPKHHLVGNKYSHELSDPNS